MRSFEQRKEEIFARGKEKIARRKKITKRVVMTCVPICLCVCIAGGWLVVRNGGTKLAMDSAAPESNMAMDSVAQGDVLYDGAQVPEMSPADEDFNMSPGDCKPMESGMQLLLYRGGREFAYTEQETLNIFLEILEGESVDLSGGDVIYEFGGDPAKLTGNGQYAVQLIYPDGQQMWYTLWDTQLTSQDGLQYTLTREEASILHKLMEIDWEGKTGEARPWYEEEIIETAAEQITWNYYVATAVQNAETGEWTVTFWSRSRMDSQVVIVDRYGGVLEVKAGSFLSESE